MSTSVIPMPGNPTATVVNEAIDGIFKVATAAAYTSIVAALDAAEPAFALPVISTLTDDAIQYLINLIANAVYQEFALYVAFTIIDIQSSGQATAVNTALAALIAAQKGGDSAQIQTALIAFGNAVAALTHIDGSANPGSL